MPREARAKVFWSGGSQAVRIPKDLRLPDGDVTIERRGNGLLIVPVEQKDDWAGFWDRLLTLKAPVKRWKTSQPERRKPL
jgi:virulence-associated protein VagC